jgi:hypothetical protein
MLDCKIFVNGAANECALIRAIADAINGVRLEDGVRGDGVELLTSTNDDADSVRKVDFPGGFLYFDNIVEVYFSPNIEQEARAATVATVLTCLWELGLPAVAACDYEDELPKSAGTDGSAPWPAHE